MAGGQDAGLNISTGVGSGEAHVMHWEQFNKTLYQINQRDLAQQRAILDDFNKSNIKLKDAGGSIRPIDMPKAQEMYKTFRDASIALQDQKISRDPAQRAFFSQVRDEAYTNYLNHAEHSKEANKFDIDLDTQRLKDKGVNWIEPLEYSQKKQLFRQTPVEQLDQMNLRNPAIWTVLPDDRPKDMNKRIYGDQQVQENRMPVKDKAGNVRGYDVEKINAYKKPVLQVASDALNTLSSHSLTNEAKAEFENLKNTAPDKLQSVITEANKIIKAQVSDDLQPELPMDYTGYFAAKHVINSQIKTPAGDKAFEPDKEYQRKQDQQFRLFMQNRGFSHAEKMAKLRDNLKDDDAPTVPNMTGLTKLMYEASTNPKGVFDIGNGIQVQGRELVGRLSDVVTSDNPGKMKSLTIDRASIFDPQKRRDLVNALGLDASFNEAKTPSSMSVEDSKNKVLNDFVNAVNDKFKANLNVDDINRYTIPVFMKKSTTTVYQTKGAKTIAEPQTILLPTIINPREGYSTFHSGVTQQAATKKKSQTQAQYETMDEITGERPVTPVVQVPSFLRKQ